MENRFEYKTKNLLLTNGILYFVVGILSTFSKEAYSWLAFLWWFGSIIWTYRYWSYRKHGFLNIDKTTIQINHANWKGIERINFEDIFNSINKET